ncbi:methylamine dehydrogenase [Aestuariicella sp. G3-2]|uniref:thioredoxin-like domain-containing protein n=1 Tax=Pseudomaricurvus albidus TaxID=2842452 RepID=UPI001C0D39F8|nr:thioredoxin-like domain-containing protein [Aestuariicella albida]MBU3071293.1 methylamine dehydrogenase [Aestuariicella albida]
MLEIMIILSWITILAIGLMLYALSRQIGVLHERIKPVGALSMGKALQVGESAPFFRETSLTGGMASVGGINADGRATLVFFMSSTCPVCKNLLPLLKKMGRQESQWLRLVFSSDGHEVEHRELISEYELHDYPYLLSTEIGLAYQISKLPYGVLIAPQGYVAAHGLINNREHIESLFEAYDASTKEVVHVEQLAG